MLPWYLESYVDLNQEQRKNLNELLEPFFEWHREEELPKYAEIIGDLELLLDEKIELSSIESITYDVEQAWFRIEDEMILWAIPMTGIYRKSKLKNFFKQCKPKLYKVKKNI